MQAQIPFLSEYVRWDFTLVHPDDHVVELYHQSELVARFSQLGTTKESLQVEGARHLAKEHGCNGCIESTNKSTDKYSNISEEHSSGKDIIPYYV
ncbi:MAG: hypothetical protein M0R49_11585 [Limnochordia bacterium]|jgi:hypothetical protein|nr:hypothetical protein [Limnochordia bacterium]